MNRKNDYAVNIALMLLSLLAALALAEGVLGWVNQKDQRFAMHDSMQTLMDQAEIFDSYPAQSTSAYQYHPIFGHAGVPFQFSYGEHNKKTTHNSKGYRSREYPYEKARGIKRVILLGDSQAYGVCLDDKETPAELLHGILNEKNAREQFEIINLGISGYGIDQSFLQFVVEGLRYDPDFILFFYFDRNDLQETSTTAGWGIEKPRFFFKGGSLCLTNVPPRRSIGWPNNKLVQPVKVGAFEDKSWISTVKRAIQGTQIYRYFSIREIKPEALRLFDQTKMAPFAKLFVGSGDPLYRLSRYVGCFEKEMPPKYDENEMALSVGILKKLKEIAEVKDAQLAVVGIPSNLEYDAGQKGRQYLEFQVQMKRASIPFVDLFEFGQTLQMPKDKMYCDGAGHLSAEMIRAVAQKIRKEIIRK